MRISDWSSDVCSADLPDAFAAARARRGDPLETIKADVAARLAQKQKSPAAAAPAAGVAHAPSVTASPAPLSPSGAPPGGHAREPAASAAPRSEERRGGKEGVSTCRSDWSEYLNKKETRNKK